MEDHKSKRYARLKYKLAIIDTAYLLFLLLLLQFSEFNTRLEYFCQSVFTNQVLSIALYSAVIFLLYSALSFFLDFYRSFTVEHRFGLSNQSIKSFFSDYLKGMALSLVFFMVLIEGFFYFIRNNPVSWWWMSAIFWIILSVIIARIFPVLIIPLFFKYKRIEDERLRQRILDLAAKMKVRILDVFEIDYSKKSLKANAAFVGMGRSKRVLLTDTLLRGRFVPEEIEMILAHEFAHYRYRHLVKMVSISSLVVFAAFYIFYVLNDRFFAARGMAVWDIANIGIWIFIFIVFQALVTPALNFISRAMEANADRMAIRITGDPGSFISMMEKLSEQNLADKKPPLWAKLFFYNHPPVEERIGYAKNAEVNK